MNSGVRLETIDGKCENCGNNLKFCPQEDTLKCEKCASKHKVENTCHNRKMPYNNINDDALLDWQKQQKYIKCKSCGSTINLKNNEISIECPYCESQNIVLQKDIQGLYPTQIIRFAFDRHEASLKFKEQVKKKFLVPRKFKQLIPENEIEGYYYPAFSFDVDSFSKYDGKLYRYEKRGSGDNARTVTVYFDIHGEVNVQHRDVLVESSSRLTQYELHNLLPYDFTKRADFKPDYLFGYKVEQYNEQFKNAIIRSDEIVKEQIRNNILKKYSYDGVSTLNINTNYGLQSFSYFMMPVYTFEYKYKDKKYLTYMNGQTGKVGSGLPVSKVKVAFITLFAILIVLLPILLVFFLGD